MKKERMLQVRRCGLVDYEQALAQQLELARRVREGLENETLLLLEHPHVITLGVSGMDRDVLAPSEELASRGIKVYRIRRGGEATYHGQGQLVGYPIMLFKPGDRDVKGFVWKLEEAVISTVGRYGIEASRRKGRTGVWACGAKIASIGIQISGWTTLHGFALNVTTDLSFFDLIVPCGQKGAAVTSMERILGSSPSMEEVMETFTLTFAGIFGLRLA